MVPSATGPSGSGDFQCMTRSMRDSGKAVPVDPASAIALAANVVDILVGLAAPITKLLNSRFLRRRVRKVIEAVSLDFAAQHPSTAAALVSSAEAIAHELARLMGTGKPLAPKVLADQWAATGSLNRADATLFADAFVQALHDALLGIDGFRPLFESGATVATAETVQRLEDALRAREVREVAAAYYDAADEYVHAAIALLGREETKALRSEYDASSLVAKAELNRDPRIIERFRDLRLTFRDLVEERYDDFRDAYDTGSAGTTERLNALNRGAQDFKAFVLERLA
jgi:hypothetical protein